ncbi:hypothetical protein OB955_24260 [Halobacteria archaeon AArc-m2/3/4]|uniref:Halobacterial output domain-containing protein n=1 Tax=Natronoglomus mannanivorans TaxID=2979990 RepID=A0AAP2Z1W2_9EURY|nr:hypothetical protein [Halobacteria archaeon AArc-xg1-1]MCU4975799.1 hypothetical protein [Halobacteria archaeon AArc-m2/3/4]
MSSRDDPTRERVRDEATTIRSNRFDIGANETPSTAIVRAVSRVTGHDEDELPRLYERVDPDALNSLFRETTEENRPTPVLWVFYAGFNVRITESHIETVDHRRSNSD